jgi:hypothetical protein
MEAWPVRFVVKTSMTKTLYSMIARLSARRVLVALLPVFLAACGEDSAFSGKDAVWDTYDFRHPVPYGAPVPDSRANTYDRYLRDYEQDYVPPRGYGATPQSGGYDYEQDYVPPRGYGQGGYGAAPAPKRRVSSCVAGSPGCLMGTE